MILGDFFQGLFGRLSDEDFDDPMQPCTVDEDCTNSNEKCHAMKMCGTKECQLKSDCLDIGNPAERKFMAESCNNGICKYASYPLMKSEASRMKIYF